MSIFWGICHTESCPVKPSSCAVGGLGEWSRSFVDAQLRRWGGDHFQVCRRKPLRSLCSWSLYTYSLLAEITREADSLMQVCWGGGGGRKFRTFPWKWLMVNSNMTSELEPGIAVVGSSWFKSKAAQNRVWFFLFCGRREAQARALAGSTLTVLFFSLLTQVPKFLSHHALLNRA